MKNTIITLLSLLFLTAAVSGQGFRERRRSPQGRRPFEISNPHPLGASRGPFIFGRTPALCDSHKTYIGSSQQEGILGAIDGLTQKEVLFVIDAKTDQQFWVFDFQATLGVDDIRLLGIFGLKGDNSGQAILYSPPDDENKSDLWIVSFADKSVEFNLRDVHFLGIADLDNKGGPEIIAYIPDERVVSIVGYDNGGTTSNITKSATHSQTLTPLTTSSDYQLVKKFQSQRRRRLAFDRRLFRTAEKLDFERDGVTDVVMLVEDSNGDPVGMEVRAGGTFDVKWEYTFPQENIEDILVDFHGFADVNGDGETEVFLGNNLAVTLDGTLHEIDPNFEIRILYDVDNDGFPDLVGVNPADTTVQVWGLETATSVSEEDLIIAGFQLEQNYPNPFNPSTTINYSLERAGEIELKIYDLLGREVRSLINENSPRGEFSVVWDGKDGIGKQVASGHYFYQLKAGDFQSTRKMVFLK